MFYPGTGSADGKEGDHVIVAPPYTVTAEDVESIVLGLKNAVMTVFKTST